MYIIKLCLQHVSSAGQLVPANTCYITVSYEMTVNTGLHKNSFMARIVRRQQLNWNNNGHVMKCCHTLLNSSVVHAADDPMPRAACHAFLL